MILSLEKDVLQNIVDATKYEWLEGNGSGCYANTTCVGMNTRREHGLFVIPDSSYKNKVVVLSKLEESVFIENRLHEISTNQYTGGIFPQGFKYLQKFEINPFPRFTYLVEDRVVQKTVFALSDSSIVVVRYELKNQGKPVDLVVKPFIADRLNNELGSETQGLNTDSYRGQRFVRWAPKANMPELYIYFDNGEYVTATLWYHNFYYPQDFGRFEGQSEDLFNPGFFQVQLRPYESLNLFISAHAIEDFSLDFEAIYREESDSRRNAKLFFSNHNEMSGLEGIVRQSTLNIRNTKLISISNVEHNFSTRDILFAIPGTLFFTKRFEIFKELFGQLLQKLNNGLLPTKITPGTNQVSYGAVDLPLWLINIAYQYYRLTDDLEFFDDDLFEALLSIHEDYSKGTRFNIYCDKDNLIYCGDRSTSLSWIPLKTPEGSVMRFGKLVEVNALWYNALQILEVLSSRLKKRRLASKFQKQSEKCKISFNELFLNNDQSAFYDTINPDGKRTEFRINQIIPLMLPFLAVEQKVALRIFEQVKTRLLTPYGLRSSAIDDERLTPNAPQNLNRFMADYYQSAIWPWSVQFYVEAFTRLFQNGKDEAKELHTYFKPILDLNAKGLIGHIPETVTGDAHIAQSGISDYTPAAAGVLWAFFKLIVKMRS